MILQLLSFEFEKFGFKVFKAENGQDAWNLFKSEDIDFDLTDIWLPALNGIELSHRIRNYSPFAKIAVMTGGEADVATILLQDGTADYFLPKPFAIKEICKTLTADVRAA